MLMGGDFNAQVGANERRSIPNTSEDTLQRTVAQTLGSPTPVGTGQHFLQKAILQRSNVPRNKALQANRLGTHEQSPVQKLQRRRNNGTDRHEQRSQGSDSRCNVQRKRKQSKANAMATSSIGASTRIAITKHTRSKFSTLPTPTR